MIEHEVEVRVRYPDCDPMGVAHHGVYAVWLEDARTEQLRRLGVPYRELEGEGVRFVVTELAVRYHRPACYDDVVRVCARLARPGPGRSARLEHEYVVWRGAERLATARSTLACVDGSGRPRAIPGRVIEAIAAAR